MTTANVILSGLASGSVLLVSWAWVDEFGETARIRIADTNTWLTKRLAQLPLWLASLRTAAKYAAGHRFNRREQSYSHNEYEGETVTATPTGGRHWADGTAEYEVISAPRHLRADEDSDERELVSA